MPEKLTKRAVDGLAPLGKVYVSWDSEIPGFGVKVQPSGRKIYVFKYRVGGGRAARRREPIIGVHGAVTADQACSIARSWALAVACG